MGTRFRLLLALGCVVLIQSCGGQKRGTGDVEQTIPVAVRKPLVLDRQSVVRASGSVEPRESAEVGFQVAGRLRRVYFDEGDRVRAGQVLAELDPADYLFGERMAAGQAESAQAQAAKAQAGARRQELEQARIAFEQADDEYRRLKLLFDRNSLAPNDFKKILARRDAALQQYELAQEGARIEDRRAAEAQARQAAANLDLQKKRVADTRLASPLSGVIARRLGDPGEMIQSGMPVFSVMDLNPVRVRVGVPEAEIGGIRAGQSAIVRIPSLGDAAFQGKVDLVGFAAEPNSRTFPIRILVPNPKLELRAGMVAEAEIERAERVRAITLPGESIVRDPQGATQAYVYFPDRKRAYLRRVTVGRPAGREVEIASGLDGSELIVVAGQQKLKEGALVRVEGSAK